jgi:hypothetical protein
VDGWLYAQNRAHERVDVNVTEGIDLEAFLEGWSVRYKNRMHRTLVVVIAMIAVFLNR